MTRDKLTKYFRNNKNKYYLFLDMCSTAPELIIKININDPNWNQWDWALFFFILSFDLNHYSKFTYDLCLNSISNEYSNLKTLYYDIIDTIDNSCELDKILTDKNNISSIMYILTQCDYYQDFSKLHIYKILAHIFKKFPELWNINWMWTSYHNRETLRRERKHILYRIMADIAKPSKTEQEYIRSQEFYADFQTAFYD